MENLFKYNESEVRTIIKENGEIWFAGIDVCNILDYSQPDVAIKKLDEDEKDLTLIQFRSGQKRKTYLINESGLYSLILQSRKPHAKPFKKWVTSEVLPQIRKTGSYQSEEVNYREMKLQSLSRELDKLSEEYLQSKTTTSELKKKLEAKQVELHMEVKRDVSQLRIQGI